MISLTEKTYTQLKKLGHTGDSFDKVISSVILKKRGNQNDNNDSEKC